MTTADHGSSRVSDHFDGLHFFNPGGAAPRGFADLLRWQLAGGRAPWPARLPSPFPADHSPARVDDGVRVCFVGHATFLIQTAGLNILTDPVWSERAGPFGIAGPQRVNPPGIAFDDLPRIDVVLVSHGHYDHLDRPTLLRLWQRDRPRILAPLGQDRTISSGNREVQVTTADWGDVVPLNAQASVRLEPARHWSARALGDRNRALWCAFLLTLPGAVIYFAGDTGWGGGQHFSDVRAYASRIDLALLPIGAYEPRWFMAEQHMNPDEAVRAFLALGAEQALGCHWGTFRLTNEGAEAPARDLATALAIHRVAPERFLAVRPGQVWTQRRD